LKQAAHFWEGVQDSVLAVISREKKGKGLAEMSGFVTQGRVAKTFSFTLYTCTVHSTIAIEQVHAWKH